MVGAAALACMFGILALLLPINTWVRLGGGAMSAFFAIVVVVQMFAVFSESPIIVIDERGVQVPYGSLIRKLRYIPWSRILDVELIDVGRTSWIPAIRIRTEERGWLRGGVALLVGEANMSPQEILEVMRANLAVAKL